MAKPAKQVDREVSDKSANKFLHEVLERYENIESARGKFMNTARREREAMITIYEGMAAQGVSQRAAKTNVKIVRALAKIDGWLADLAEEDRRMVQKLAKAQKDKRQLSLWANMPKQSKPKMDFEEDAPPRANGKEAEAAEAA